MNAEVIPFGKYKGQPAEVLQSDPQYAEWLLNQPWFNEKFIGIRTLIVNNFKEPADTPEHNRLQAKFLDKNFAYSVAVAIHGQHVSEKTLDRMRRFDARLGSRPEYLDCGVEFEVSGWDVLLRHRVSFEWVSSMSLEEVTWSNQTEIRRKFDYCDEVNVNLNGRVSKRMAEYSRLFWGGVFLVELKPSLGDDFPSVLRQVKAHKQEILGLDRKFRVFRCVLIEDFIATSVSFTDVREMFRTSGIRLLRVSDIPNLQLPECFAKRQA